MRINVAVQNKDRINPYGRKIVRAHKARLTAVQSINGMTTTIVVPLPITKGSKEGILLLDEQGRMHIRESFRDGRTNVQAHMDVWPTGPYVKTGYINPVEHFARVDAARAAEGRPAFKFGTDEELADELLHRVLVDPSEVSAERPEEAVLGSLGLEFMVGRFGDLPAKVGNTHFRACTTGRVVVRSHDRVTVRAKDCRTTIYWAPEGWTPNAFRTGQYVKRGTPLFKLVAPLHESPVIEDVIEVLERRTFVTHQGKRYVRLSAAKQLPRYCLACGNRRGIYPPAAKLICPECGGASVEGTEERVACACGHTGSADHFRRHLTCPCGGATTVGVKGALVVANSRYYDLESTTGMYVVNPSGVAHVQAFFRRVKAGEVKLDDVEQRLIKAPRMKRVS